MSEERKDIQQTEQASQTSSYRSIFKATSLFGGVQVYQILIGVIRSKYIAVLLGPTGMGIMGLYQSTIELVKSVSALGLEQSAVRDISEANGSGNQKRVGQTVSTVRRLVWITGILGLVLTIILSPLLSLLTFGNNDYTWGFVFLSVTVLIDQLCVGQKVVIQGMRRLRNLAKASAIGATIGLIVSIPLYYWMGINGIVPTMILTSITAMIISWYYSRKIEVENVKVTVKEALYKGRTMVKMGIALSVSGILVTFFAYILRWFIREQGGVAAVGLFTAGYAIMNSYVGMVFKAMGTDYYPRLAAVNNDNEKCRKIINQQAEVAILILAPVVISCIILMPFIIRIIYSAEFLDATDYVLWAISGMMLKAISWSIAFSFIAKAEARLFIINETIGNVVFLALHLLGYYFYGLTGLGIAFLITQIEYVVQVYVIAHTRYQFRFTSSLTSVFTIQLVAVISSFLIVHIWHSTYAYIPLVMVLLVSGYYSITELEKRMHLMQVVKNKISKQS